MLNILLDSDCLSECSPDDLGTLAYQTVINTSHMTVQLPTCYGRNLLSLLDE